MKKTMYMTVYDHFVQEILNNKYKPGDKLPTELEISSQFNVSRITIKKAMELLTEANYVNRISGKGTYVNKNLDNTHESYTAEVNSSRLIGVMMSDLTDAFGIKFMKGVQSEVTKNGYSTLLHMSYNSQEEENIGIERLIKEGVKGVIIMAVHGDKYSPLILKHAINEYPLVLADIYLNGLSVPFVGSDNNPACRKLTEYLFSLGHSNIVFISSIATTSAILERRDGFISAYANNNISMNSNNIILNIRSTMPGKGTPNYIREEINRLKKYFSANPQISAVIAADYNIACLVKTTIEELKLDVPNDISIACFDEPESPYRNCFFTHIRQNEYEIGKNAVRLLLKVISGEKTDEKIILETELVIGASTKEFSKIK